MNKKASNRNDFSTLTTHAKVAMCDFSGSAMSGLWLETSAEGVVKDSNKNKTILRIHHDIEKLGEKFFHVNSAGGNKNEKLLLFFIKLKRFNETFSFLC